MKARTLSHCVDKDRKEIPILQIFSELSRRSFGRGCVPQSGFRTAARKIPGSGKHARTTLWSHTAARRKTPAETAGGISPRVGRRRRMGTACGRTNGTSRSGALLPSGGTPSGSGNAGPSRHAGIAFGARPRVPEADSDTIPRRRPAGMRDGASACGGRRPHADLPERGAVRPGLLPHGANAASARSRGPPAVSHRGPERIAALGTERPLHAGSLKRCPKRRKGAGFCGHARRIAPGCPNLFFFLSIYT